MRLGFPHRAERYRPGRSAFSSPFCRSCGYMAGFLIRGWELVLLGCGGTSTFSRGETFAACWLHEPPPISNQPMRFGFPHRADRYRPGESQFSSPVCWSCRYMEEFLIRGWERILPRCGGMSALPRRATLAARWLHEPYPISNQPVGLGFPHPPGRYRPHESPLSSPGCSSRRDTELFVNRG